MLSQSVKGINCNIGITWNNCVNKPKMNQIIIQDTKTWWNKRILPFIPSNERQYYQKPFGDTNPPPKPNPNNSRIIVNVSQPTNIQTKVTKKTPNVGFRAPICYHYYGETVTIIKGYVTLFIEGCAPKTFGPGDTFYKPGGRILTIAFMSHPIYQGKRVRQPNSGKLEFNNVDTTGNGGRPFVFIEDDSKNGGTNWSITQQPIISGKSFGNCGSKIYF